MSVRAPQASVANRATCPSILLFHFPDTSAQYQESPHFNALPMNHQSTCSVKGTPHSLIRGERPSLRPPGGDVGEPSFIGKRGDELIAAGSELGRHAPFRGLEAGKKQQPSIGKWLPPFRGNALWQRPRRADHYGLRTSQKDLQAFPLHRGVKTAHHATACLAPSGCLIMRGQNGAAGTAGGAEERCHGQREQIEIAHGGELRRRTCTQPLVQASRVTNIPSAQCKWRHHRSGVAHHFHVLGVEELLQFVLRRQLHRVHCASIVLRQHSPCKINSCPFYEISL